MSSRHKNHEDLGIQGRMLLLENEKHKFVQTEAGQFLFTDTKRVGQIKHFVKHKLAFAYASADLTTLFCGYSSTNSINSASFTEAVGLISRIFLFKEYICVCGEASLVIVDLKSLELLIYANFLVSSVDFIGIDRESAFIVDCPSVHCFHRCEYVNTLDIPSFFDASLRNDILAFSFIPFTFDSDSRVWYEAEKREFVTDTFVERLHHLDNLELTGSEAIRKIQSFFDTSSIHTAIEQGRSTYETRARQINEIYHQLCESVFTAAEKNATESSIQRFFDTVENCMREVSGMAPAEFVLPSSPSEMIHIESEIGDTLDVLDSIVSFRSQLNVVAAKFGCDHICHLSTVLADSLDNIVGPACESQRYKLRSQLVEKLSPLYDACRAWHRCNLSDLQLNRMIYVLRDCEEFALISKTISNRLDEQRETIISRFGSETLDAGVLDELKIEIDRKKCIFERHAMWYHRGFVSSCISLCLDTVSTFYDRIFLLVRAVSIAESFQAPNIDRIIQRVPLTKHVAQTLCSIDVSHTGTMIFGGKFHTVLWSTSSIVDAVDNHLNVYEGAAFLDVESVQFVWGDDMRAIVTYEECVSLHKFITESLLSFGLNRRHIIARKLASLFESVKTFPYVSENYTTNTVLDSHGLPRLVPFEKMLPFIGSHEEKQAFLVQKLGDVLMRLYSVECSPNLPLGEHHLIKRAPVNLIRRMIADDKDLRPPLASLIESPYFARDKFFSTRFGLAMTRFSAERKKVQENGMAYRLPLYNFAHSVSEFEEKFLDFFSDVTALLHVSGDSQAYGIQVYLHNRFVSFADYVRYLINNQDLNRIVRRCIVPGCDPNDVVAFAGFIYMCLIQGVSLGEDMLPHIVFAALSDQRSHLSKPSVFSWAFYREFSDMTNTFLAGNLDFEVVGKSCRKVTGTNYDEFERVFIIRTLEDTEVFVNTLHDAFYSYPLWNNVQELRISEAVFLLGGLSKYSELSVLSGLVFESSMHRGEHAHLLEDIIAEFSLSDLNCFKYWLSGLSNLSDYHVKVHSAYDKPRVDVTKRVLILPVDTSLIRHHIRRQISLVMPSEHKILKQLLSMDGETMQTRNKYVEESEKTMMCPHCFSYVEITGEESDQQCGYCGLFTRCTNFVSTVNALAVEKKILLLC
ncbi:hypothetical protein PCE1_004915 [Barthelona sp. PCE]